MAELLVIGNPLLDLVAPASMELLEKYDLKNGDAVLANEKQMGLFEELERDYEIQYIPGGAGQNTARATAWMVQKPLSVAYIGCVGQDSHGDVLRKASEEAGLAVHYLVNKEQPTGVCASLTVDKDRSLVTALGAANHYVVDHLMKSEIHAVLEQVKIVYITGFVLTVSLESILEAGKHCAENNKTFCFNLAAPFLMHAFKDGFLQVIPYTDYIFGNVSEAQECGAAMGWGDDPKEIGKKLCAMDKANGKRERIVVLTDGAKPTIVIKGDVVEEHPVIVLPKEQVEDTVGAGDSFCGGFLSQLVRGSDIATCCKAGAYCASIKVQRVGCTFPDKPDF